MNCDVQYHIWLSQWFMAVFIFCTGIIAGICVGGLISLSVDRKYKRSLTNESR